MQCNVKIWNLEFQCSTPVVVVFNVMTTYYPTRVLQIKSRPRVCLIGVKT